MQKKLSVETAQRSCALKKGAANSKDRTNQLKESLKAKSPASIKEGK